MPQLSVTQNAIAAQPGMVFDAELAPRDVITRIAAVNIPFGVECEIIQAGSQIGQAQPLADANLAGTVTVTAASAAITFSVAQTLPAGQALVFSAQPGVVYYLAAAVSAATAGTLTVTYSGSTSSTGTTALSPYQPKLAGVSIFDPLGVEQNYVTWALPTVLAGTVSLTNNSASITFSTAQTLPAGAALTFSSQNGVQYFLAAAINNGTAGTLTVAYTGPTSGAATATNIGPGSSASGWKAGTPVPFLRRGRIWGATDGTAMARNGPVNVWHSSTGANPQGVFTSAAVSQTVGAEVDVAPNCLLWNPDAQAVNGVDPFGTLFQCVPIDVVLTHAS